MRRTRNDRIYIRYKVRCKWDGKGIGRAANTINDIICTILSCSMAQLKDLRMHFERRSRRWDVALRRTFPFIFPLLRCCGLCWTNSRLSCCLIQLKNFTFSVDIHRSTFTARVMWGPKMNSARLLLGFSQMNVRRQRDAEYRKCFCSWP